MTAQLIKTSGAIIAIQPAKGKYFSLKELQGYVGGYIEVHQARDHGRLVVMNEEGILLHLPPNPAASEIARHLLTLGNRGLLGDVVICRDDQMER